MALIKRGKVWWYEFWFARRRIRESTKTESKTVAKAAEQKRRRELEEGFNNLEDVRYERVRTVREIADEYLANGSQKLSPKGRERQSSMKKRFQG